MASSYSHRESAMTTDYQTYWDRETQGRHGPLEWKLQASVDVTVRYTYENDDTTYEIQYGVNQSETILDLTRRITKIEAKGTSSSGTFTLTPREAY